MAVWSSAIRGFPVPRAEEHTLSVFVRLFGALLLAATLFPGEILLDGLDQGFHRDTMMVGTRAHRQLLTWGAVGILLVALVLGRLVGDSMLGRALVRARPPVLRLSPRRWAVVTGVTSFGLALLVQRGVYEGLLTNPDEMVSLIQARYLATGRLGGTLTEDPAHWLAINALVTPAGWVSQYTPGHLVVLTLGVLTGAPLLVGPVAAGLATGLFSRSFELLLPERVFVARAGSLLLALCPFTAFLGGQILSHSTTMVAGAAGLYASLRSRDAETRLAGLSWAWAAGVAGAFMVAARPWTGLTVGTVLVLGPWVGRFQSGALVSRSVAVLMGGAPLGALFLAYHRVVFGASTRLGYVVAFGPAHGIGFHVDPWGYEYTLQKALGVTSGDLAMLGLQIWESPLSPLLLVGAWLLLRPGSLRTPAGFLLAWAMVSIPANLVYWFHAPRMYVESVPAWLLLAVMAVADLGGTREGGDERGAEAAVGESVRASTYRATVGWACVLGVAAPVWFLGQRVSVLRWDDMTRARLVEPAELPDQPSLVFVHTNWWDRIGRLLQAEGMRSDSTEILLRLRDPCELWSYAQERRTARLAGSPPPPPIPLETGPIGAPTPICQEQIRSDRLDVVALLPMLWQGDLPGLPPRGALYVRDYGPESNQRLLDAYPDRVPLLFRADGTGRPPVLVPYEDGMETLWR